MQGRGAGRSRGNNAGRGGGRLQGRGNNAGRGGLRRAAVGKDEADSLKRWSKATIATNSDAKLMLLLVVMVALFQRFHLHPEKRFCCVSVLILQGSSH